jgi:hypothetical protein
MAWMAAGSLLFGSVPAFANNDEGGPSAGAMVADAVVARPLGVVLTTVGAVTFVVSLPFSAIGGNVEAAAENLVLKPARETFVRCLGCKTSGRHQVPSAG